VFRRQRWLTNRTTDGNGELRLLGVYLGHTRAVTGAIEKDENTLVTGSYDETIRVWNKTTCECLYTLPMATQVTCMMKSKDNSLFGCGLSNGRVHLRRLHDFSFVFYLRFHRTAVDNICELEDGSFVSGESRVNPLRLDGLSICRWNESGKVFYQLFTRVTRGRLLVTELKRDVLVVTDGTLSMWKMSPTTRERVLKSTPYDQTVTGLAKLKNSQLFVSGSRDQTLRVWDSECNCIETHDTGGAITVMTGLRDGSIVAANYKGLWIRRPYWLETFPFFALSY